MRFSEREWEWLLTILLLLVIWFGNFVFLLTNTHFYDTEFTRLNVNASLGMNVVSYVNGKTSLSDEFNEREASHLADVRNLFSKVKIIYYASLLLLAGITVFLFTRDNLIHLIPTAFIRSGLISLIFIIVLFLLSLNFSAFFTNIHKPFFASNSWTFPADSLLIQIFPVEFFKNFTTTLIRSIFLNSAIFFGAGVFVRKKFRMNKKNDSS